MANGPTSAGSLPTAPPYEVYSTVLRSYTASLRRCGLKAAVLPALSASTRKLLDAPPEGVWISGTAVNEIFQTIGRLRGVSAVRAFNRDATANSLEFVRGHTIIEGVLRLFGPSPAKFFARQDSYSARMIRGVTTKYTPVTARSGIYESRQLNRRGLSPESIASTGGSIEGLLDILGVRGRVSEGELVRDGQENAASFSVAW